MTFLVYLLVITHPFNYAEQVHKYPMPDLATCQSVLKDTKIDSSQEERVAVVTCVTEPKP